MEIRLQTKHPQLEANNITRAESKDFADLIREFETKKRSDKVEGRFAIYKKERGPVVIELFEEESLRITTVKMQ